MSEKLEQQTRNLTAEVQSSQSFSLRSLRLNFGSGLSKLGDSENTYTTCHPGIRQETLDVSRCCRRISGWLDLYAGIGIFSERPY